MNSELLRLVDSIHRDKDVDKGIIFEALEAAMLSAARKQYGTRAEVTVTIDRETGEVTVLDGGVKVDPPSLGRISAQTAKQIIIQRIREAERDVVYQDFERRAGEIVNGVIQRFEGPNVIVNLGKTEGILPKREQVPGENYRPSERVRAIVVDVRKAGPKVKIALSRTHPDLIRRLFELEVPEISDHTIEIKSLAREPGSRSKIAVHSTDSRVDCVGACVGVRGTRIKNIVDELNGEKIDIVRWSDAIEAFVANALRPAEISSIHMIHDRQRAVVIVPEDQLALGIGKKGQNVRLASKLVGWEIDIYTAKEFDQMREQAKKDFACLPGITDRTAAKLVESGVFSLAEFADSPVELLTRFDGITTENIDSLQDSAVVLIRQRRQEEEKRARESPVVPAPTAGPAEPPAAPGAAAPAAPSPTAEPGKEVAAPVPAEPSVSPVSPLGSPEAPAGTQPEATPAESPGVSPASPAAAEGGPTAPPADVGEVAASAKAGDASAGSAGGTSPASPGEAAPAQVGASGENPTPPPEQEPDGCSRTDKSSDAS